MTNVLYTFLWKPPTSQILKLKNYTKLRSKEAAKVCILMLLRPEERKINSIPDDLAQKNHKSFPSDH